MFALAQIAQITSTDTLLPEADTVADTVEKAVETVVSTQAGRIPEEVIAIVATVAFFGFLILLVIGGLLVRYLLSRRRMRLIELAIQQNQPDVARELIGRTSSQGRWLIAAVVIIVLIVVLAHNPLLLALAIVAVILWVMKPERRADVYRSAANGLGAAKNWLDAKAPQPPAEKDNASSPDPGEQK